MDCRGRAVAGQAACAVRMGRLETEFLAGEENLPAPADLSGQWIDRGHARHPLFVFNRFGDPERSRLCPGNVHSADGRRGVLQPVVERYRERGLRRCFRGDAAFAAPDIHEFPEAEGDRYTIGLKADAILRQSIACLPTRPVDRPPDHMIRTHAGFSHRAGSWDKKRRVAVRVERHPGERVSRIGLSSPG